MNHEDLVKIAIIGSEGVGKSNILLRYCKDEFFDNYKSTIGIEFFNKKINYQNNIYQLQFWDTAGQERFRGISSSFYKGTHAILLVYDITNKNSFKKLSEWIKEIEKYSKENILVFLIGNKNDLIEERKILTQDGIEFAKKNNFLFFETSAKENININEIFEILLSEVIKEKIDNKNISYINLSERTITKKLNYSNDTKNKCKCW